MIAFILESIYFGKKYVIYNFSYLHVIEMNGQTIWITISEMLRKNWEFA
jgi:hypothetical protein